MFNSQADIFFFNGGNGILTLDLTNTNISDESLHCCDLSGWQSGNIHQNEKHISFNPVIRFLESYSEELLAAATTL